MAPKALFYLLFVPTLAFPLMTGCGGDDSPTAPGAPAPTADVRIRARRLDIVNDCDGPAGSSSSGDFYVSLRIADLSSGTEVVLDRKDGVLVQGTDGDSVVPSGLEAVGNVPLVDGRRIIARISFYENDPSGPQVSAGTAHTYVYEAASEKWKEDAGDGVFSAGNVDFDSISLEDFNGDPCNATLVFAVSQLAGTSAR